ncbi:hypothetical protein D9M69_650700 [compost metagenome]
MHTDIAGLQLGGRPRQVAGAHEGQEHLEFLQGQFFVDQHGADSYSYCPIVPHVFLATRFMWLESCCGEGACSRWVAPPPQKICERSALKREQAPSPQDAEIAQPSSARFTTENQGIDRPDAD